MHISKSRFINWTRCPLFFSMELKHNPSGHNDIDAEREHREEMLGELAEALSTAAGDGDEDEEFDASASEELRALLPYYQEVEHEALIVARRCFRGSFIADSKEVGNQKLFEYRYHGHTYRCYVDIYNESEDEINIIEVKATTNKKYTCWHDDKGRMQGLYFSDVAKGKRGGKAYPLFVREGNIWHLNEAGSRLNDEAHKNYKAKIADKLLNRYANEGKYPHDIAFQRFVIENALRAAGDNRHVNFYLAVLNSEYIYDGAVDAQGKRIYKETDGQEIVTFYDMNEISAEYQRTIADEIAKLEGYISSPHDTGTMTPVGKWCAWGENTQCVFWKHCYQNLRDVPESNAANKYLFFHGFNEFGIGDKYGLINEGYLSFGDVPLSWLKSESHKIQRDCYDNGMEYIDVLKMQHWFDQVEYPIYHFDFESFASPLPRFRGESPYRQSVFEFSLHIERVPGVCDKEIDNFIFLNRECDDDEREALARAIVEHFEFNEDGSLHGTMLAQNTSFERGRLKELAKLFPAYRDKLLAICKKSMDLIDLLRNNKELYRGLANADTINYYHKDLSGSYSIKKTLPVLVPSLTYKGMDVGNGVQAYIAYINYDSPTPTYGLGTKEERRHALSIYCQQDTWAMVEILRAVRKKMEDSDGYRIIDIHY